MLFLNFMFRPDETAKDFFRRLTLPPLRFSNVELSPMLPSDLRGSIDFGDVVEVQVGASEIPEAVLSIIVQFLLIPQAAEKAHVYHASSGPHLVRPQCMIVIEG
jgi:hypothetical protein